MDIKDEIIKNIKNFYSSAELVYKNNDYTSACILYFKALFSVIDYIILSSGYDIPRDHTERFEILQKNFKSIYDIMDKIFSIYRSTYSFSINKKDCDEVKHYVAKYIKEYKIFE